MDDDDFYGDNVAAPVRAEGATNGDEDDNLSEQMDEDAEDDSDSDIEIKLERTEPAPSDGTPQTQKPAPIKQEQQRATPSQSSTQPAALPKSSSTPRPSNSNAPPPLVPSGGQPGHAYPEIHTSTVDVDANPVYPPAGKPIAAVEIDADLAEHEKPWRLPEADQSDFFNYGFDEFTWATYVLKQQSMAEFARDAKGSIQNSMEMMGMAPPMMGGVPGAGAGAGPDQPGQQQQQQQGGPGAAGMMGMMNDPAMMQQMIQYMTQNGISDPSQMDFANFQMFMQGGGQQPGGGQQGQWAGYGGGGPGDGGGGGGAGRGGRGRGGGRGRW